MSNYHTFSDDKLIVLLKASDDAAFNEIFHRYYNLLLSYTCRRLNDTEISKDLINDAFADIWEKRLTVNIPGELIAFLYTVMKNRIVNHYRHKNVKQKYANYFQRSPDQTYNGTDHLVRHNDLQRKIEKEIVDLPEKMRIVFELSRKKGLNRIEISEYLDMPENTVKTNLQRALAILKKRLGVLTYSAHVSNSAMQETETNLRHLLNS